jgi:hypothetical protein
LAKLLDVVLERPARLGATIPFAMESDQMAAHHLGGFSGGDE